jgi:hypothetical protein
MPADLHAFILTALATLVALVVAARLLATGRAGPAQARAARRAVPVLGLWLAAALALSHHGFFAAPDRFTAADWPGFVAFAALMAAPPVAVLLAMRRSAGFAALLAGLPLPFLAGLQVYRLGGGVFLSLQAQGRVPDWFGLSTGIADLAVGLAALPLAVALAAGWRLAVPAAVAWSVFGLADFANALATAFLAFTGAVAMQPAPALIGAHPLALAALFLVPLAVVGHGLILARLLPQMLVRRGVPGLSTGV